MVTHDSITGFVSLLILHDVAGIEDSFAAEDEVLVLTAHGLVGHALAWTANQILIEADREISNAVNVWERRIDE